VSDPQRDNSLDVAVVGMSGRFPGAASIEDLWDAVRAGRVLTTRLDDAAITASGVMPELAGDPMYVPVGGLLDRADHFDAHFFGSNPRDAEITDPQQRLLLETSWTALEDAGYPSGSGLRTGVYATASGSSYLRMLLAAGCSDPTELEHVLLGSERDYLATRIAYKLGLTGPAMTILTACSSSLVAVHVAAQALVNGECEAALVASSSVTFPQAGHLHVPGGILSRTGRCRPFDAAADGTVAGSGVAAVVLRPLRDAVEAGDVIHGVILGSAVNNDGSTKAGFPAPSVDGQIDVIRQAYDVAGIGADTVGYLESHGTGTLVGDPIEWLSTGTALAELGASPASVAVGTLKANIGHLDATAGLAGLIKALLVVGRGVVPPASELDQPNPLLESDDSPLRLPGRAESWTARGPRRAGVSSFGVGGTNAHVIVEQPPVRAARDAATTTAVERDELLLVSAASPASLNSAIERLAADILADPARDDRTLPDVASTLLNGRAHLAERAVCVASSLETADAALDALASGPRRRASGTPGTDALVLLMPGQGTQRPGMALACAERFPDFRQGLDECLDLVAAIDGEGTAAELRDALLDSSFPRKRIAQTDLAQPALFVVGHSLARMLAAHGVEPDAIIGHSLGEITGACLAGLLSLGDALRLVVARGRAMQACEPGAMLAVACREQEAMRIVRESGLPVELAAVNGPETCVLAGRIDDIYLLRDGGARHVDPRVLRTSHAFHTELIAPACVTLASMAPELDGSPARYALVSNMTGTIMEPGERLPASYWARHARETVRFGDGLGALASRFAAPLCLELGPGTVLSSLATIAGLDARPVLPSPPDGDVRGVLEALGSLWTAGHPIDLVPSVGAGGRHVSLPTYAFDTRRYWAAAAVMPVGGPGAVDTAREPAPHRDDQGDADGQGDAGHVAIIGALWSEMLGHHEIADNADFFDLGGDSLALARLSRGIGRRFGIEVGIRQLLGARTISAQAELVVELVTAAVLAESSEGAPLP
jgi:phthiocerol/phenolphthiocerol synthesis type-I polyketide synthase E